MKKVIFWEPKKDVKRKKDGSEILGKFIGKFRTKVDPETPGATNYKGTLATGKAYDYWGINVDSVAGKLRWIDKQDNGDFGTSIVMFLETEKYLHKISVKYDPYNLKDIMNPLCGLGKGISTQVINVSYWVREAQREDKSFKVNDKGEPIWNKSISFRDIAPQFSYEEWKDFAQKNGLEWTQIKRADGKKEWNCDAEYCYWDGRLVGLQKFLLKEGVALPFTYNSMTACEAPNPSGGGNLSTTEIEQCKEIYERVKGEYQFPFNRSQVDADAAFDQPEQSHHYQEQPRPLPNPTAVIPPSQAGVPFPVQEPQFEEEWEAMPNDGEKLPF